MDAGMPTVADLTRELRLRLCHVPDVNNRVPPEFAEVFDRIAQVDAEVAKNYERFFEWIALILKARQRPFRNLLCAVLDEACIEAMSRLAFVVGEEIANLLTARNNAPDYLARFAHFLPDDGPLKVFTLNFDTCVEDACEAAGIAYETGFDPATGEWDVARFRSSERRVHLYKLHGSLRWFDVRPSKGHGEIQHHLRVIEVRPENRRQLAQKWNTQLRKPELILGPGSKIQVDDPFFALLYSLQSATRAAQTCVVIGYGYRDPHVEEILSRAVDDGMAIVDVNPGEPAGKYSDAARYHHLPLGAREALLSGQLSADLLNLRRDG